MPRFKLVLEYDGTGFRGWQRQANGPSVQAALEDAVFLLTKERSLVVGAGRTDSGVHALRQVAHVDLVRTWALERLQGGLNHHLGRQPVAVLAVEEVAPPFHARFSAVRRHYLYRILDRRAPAVLLRDRVWHIPRRLDSERMHDAAQALVGRHDFTSYRSADCQSASPWKTLALCAVRRFGAEIEVHASARSFLHHQVRNIVGTLALIGAGKRPIGFAGEVLSACDRRLAGPTAPPCGLYLAGVDYPL